MIPAINCLIVDDEPIAQKIIETYCSHLPELKVVASCSNVFGAKPFLQNHQIDILFLDINMPVLDGISFLKTLKNPPQVIFTTAYKEYAVDAFDLAACDYLLKPFSLERFLISVDKAMAALEKANRTVLTSDTQAEDFVFVKTGGKIYKLLFDDILYTEANGNYAKIICTQRQLLLPMTFTATNELLPPPIFIRVHRSFTINKSKISHIEGNVVYIGTHEIPIGNNYKTDFLSDIGL